MGKGVERAGKLALARFAALFLDRRRVDPASLAGPRVERLLVIRQHNQMGDMLLAVPAFRGLRRRFPDARITLVAAPINAEAARRVPYVDEVLTYAKREHRRDPFGLPRFVRELRRRRFDAVIVLSTVSFSVTSMLLAAASRARVRIGSTSASFGHDLSARFYHIELPLPSPAELGRMHESAHNLYPLAAIGVREDDLSSLLVPTEAEERDAERFAAAAFGAGTPFIVVHPGAGKSANIWPAERFAAVAERFAAPAGAGVVAVRGPVDGGAADAFLRALGRPPAVVSTPAIGFLGALMKRAACTLCNDTGVMHVAGAVGARCVAVFGPTDPLRWKPVGDRVVAVRSRDGRVESVGVETVLAAAEGLAGLG